MITFETAIIGSLEKWENALVILRAGGVFPNAIAEDLRDICTLCGYAQNRYQDRGIIGTGGRCNFCPWTKIFNHPCTHDSWYVNLDFATRKGRLEEIILYVIGCLKVIKRLYPNWK